MRCFNISVRPGDHAPFLETRGNSVRLGRTVRVLINAVGHDVYVRVLPSNI